MPLSPPDTTPSELRALALARLGDAQALIDAGRIDGARYLCGYAVELSLKARICDTLGWQKYPFSNNEFRDYKSFKTHNLEVLLTLTGREIEIKRSHYFDWNTLISWDPESRYLPVGSLNVTEVEDFLLAARTITTHL